MGGHPDIARTGGISPSDADKLAERLLGELRTKLGGLHIAHARRVAAGVPGTSDPRIVAAALLHDVLEKTDLGAEALEDLTGDAELVRLVVAVTRRPAESELVYLSRCAVDPATLLVKRLDLLDKLTADDSEVAGDIAGRLRREAGRRLALLDSFARRHADTRPSGELH